MLSSELCDEPCEEWEYDEGEEGEGRIDSGAILVEIVR